MGRGRCKKNYVYSRQKHNLYPSTVYTNILHNIYCKLRIMKQLLTLLALMLLSACYTSYPRYYDPNPPIQRPLQQERWWWYQDPIYWGYPAPYFYRVPRRQVIVIPQPRPQQPRTNNNRSFGPQVPRSNSGSNAPIRVFPKPEDKK